MARIVPIRCEVLEAELADMRRLGRPATGKWNDEGWDSVFVCNRRSGEIWRPLKSGKTSDRAREYVTGKNAILEAVVKEVKRKDPLGRRPPRGGHLREQDLVFHMYSQQTGDWEPAICIVGKEPGPGELRLQIDIETEEGSAQGSQDKEGSSDSRTSQQPPSGFAIARDPGPRLCPSCQSTTYDGDQCGQCGHGTEGYGL